MEPTLITPQFAVFDDVLSPEQLNDLRCYLNTSPFDDVHHLPDEKYSGGVKKVWRLHDGYPLKGPEFHLTKTGDLTPTPHPSFIILLDELMKCVPQTPIGPEWERLNSSMWVYPTGTGASLHADGSSGAYAYYLHPEWRLHWGGMLVVLDEATEHAKPDAPQPWLLDDDEHRRVWTPGHGTVILPKPNRVVFLAPTAQHMITTVTQGTRMSVGGFFKRSLPKIKFNLDDSGMAQLVAR